MEQLNENEAIHFAQSGQWKELTKVERAQFQLQQRLLCMPIDKYQEALEHALDRPVWTHEMADPEALLEELNGEIPAPSFDEILVKLNRMMVNK